MSLPFDQRLAPDDIAGSRAHVRGLARIGILTDDGARRGARRPRPGRGRAGRRLVRVRAVRRGHPHRGRAPRHRAGRPAGAKLHTGRSRNDQVATDLRLYTKRALLDGRRAGSSRCSRCCSTGPSRPATPTCPGYTHLQRAQPVTLAHHLLAHGWALARDVDRLLDARRRADVSPLGAGALAGSSIPLDPDGVADDLGFAARFENSLDAVSDRDFVAEALFALTMVGAAPLADRRGAGALDDATSSASPRLDDAYATGSSMMPQKKNPDIAELARGKAGRLIGDLTGLLATLKGLPLAYNRDLQEDKEPLFDAVDQVALGLSAHDRPPRHDPLRHRPHAGGRRLARTPRPPTWPSSSCSRGTPFREAHAIVGGLVRDSLERHVPLADLVAAHPAFERGRSRAARARRVASTRRTTPGRRRPRRRGRRSSSGSAPASPADRERASPWLSAWRTSTTSASATARSTCSGWCSTPTTSPTATTPPTCGSGRSARCLEGGEWDVMVKKATITWDGRRQGARRPGHRRVGEPVGQHAASTCGFDGTVDGAPVFTADLTYVAVRHRHHRDRAGPRRASAPPPR